MLVTSKMNKFVRGMSKASLSCASVGLLIAIGSSDAEASTCYHHYNSDAWHGQGMAIVFCLNSGDTYGGSPMAACSAYNPDTGEKLTGFVAHSQTDHGRQVFTDPNTPGRTFGSNPIVIVCKGQNGEIYSYPIANASAMSYPGTCSSDTGYVGAASQCVGDSDPLLTVRKKGNGKGKVVGNQVGLYGGKIYCGSTCNSDAELFYKHLEQQVTLTATADPGYMFRGWEGACEGSGTCTLKMVENKTVTAVFEPMASMSALSLLLRPYFTVGGTVSSLATGNSVVLKNSNGDTETMSSNSSFVFDSELVDGTSYSVSVLTQPTTPAQTCTVSKGSGTINRADVTDVLVDCVTKQYTVGGTLSGFAGAATNIVLQNNGGDDLSLGADSTTFTFASPIDDYSDYNITVLTDPTAPHQDCTVTNGTGTLKDGNVTDVAVNCVTTQYTVGGNVSGFGGGTDLELRNNGGDPLFINADGTFAFSTALDDLSLYDVSVLTNPTIPNQTCTVAPGSGSGGLAGADITNVAVNCVTDTFTVGVTVTNFAGGTSLVLQNNLGDNLTVDANASPDFATGVADESVYSVSVLTQPTGPNQDCTVTSGSGTIHQAAVSGIGVDCAMVQYSILGAVSGLAIGETVVIQNNLAADTLVLGNGNYIFGSDFDDGSTYSVTAIVDGGSRTCVVTNSLGSPTGLIWGANVDPVDVDCTP